ncbi:MAG: penicillin acylase family protein [Pyrinomonadaceae bacterium]
MQSTKQLLTLLLILLTTTPTAAQEARSPSSLTRILPGLKSSVSIHRDARGVPHIEATNDEDLYFAQGYATASDRLWQMDLLRRTARGELSEIFGRVALEEDKRRRVFNFAALAEHMARTASPQLRAAMDSYARGVNAYIATLDEKTLPLEFRVLQYKPRAWQPSDSHVVGKIFAEVLSTSWPADLARSALGALSSSQTEKLFPDVSPLDVLVVGSDRKVAPRTKRTGKELRQVAADADVRQFLGELHQLAETTRATFKRIGLDAEDLAASNNWVISGRRSATGKPLLANDPHLAPSTPSIWYLTHLKAPGVHAAGVTAPGLPGIVIGHNECIAWGMTNLGPDVQDLYLEKFDPADARRYRTPTGWRTAEVRREEIKVRKSVTDPTLEIVDFEVTVTRHGPIVYEKDNRRYALRWTALAPDAIEFDSSYKINRARNWNEFRSALANYPGPTQNFVYADTSGNIGYYGAGRIPVRRTGDGSLPYDGSTDAGAWTRFIPFAELPHVYNPPSGVIVTANSRVVGRSYPYHLTHRWSPPYRARRIYDLLLAKQKHTAEDFSAMHGDVYTINGALFAREVVKIGREEAAARGTSNATGAPDADWQQTLDLLEQWDHRMASDSRAAILASAMYEAFRRRVLVALLGPEAAADFRGRDGSAFIDEAISKRSPEALPKEFRNYAEFLRACYRDAREALAKRLGDDAGLWTWGRDVQARFPHPLARAPLVGQRFTIPLFPQNGAGSIFPTVNVGSSVSMQFVADTSDWDATRQGVALGQSGDPASPHWKDQLADWRASRPQVLPFSASAVARATVQTLQILPATNK